VRIWGGLGAYPALANALNTVRGKVSQRARSPVFGATLVLTPLMLAAAVGASGPAVPVRQEAVTTLAAVAPATPDMSGPSVITVKRPPQRFHVATATASAPPPAVVVSSPGSLRIPSMALSAYRNAEVTMSRAKPDCGVSWNLLAGIGRIESGHANGGATDARGTVVRPIYGPALDGTLPGNEVIVQSRQAGRVTYARAIGPMQFLPGTWSRYASDGDGDGKSDPQNLYDSALAAARYLCSGGLDLRDSAQVMSAVLRYNNSVAYARNVLGWAASYATGIAPVDLPPISGPVPEISNAHLNSRGGIGPDLPVSAAGLPATDPLAQLVTLNQTDVANQMPVPPGPEATGTHSTAPCVIFCISGTAAQPVPPAGLPGAVPAMPAAAPMFPPAMPAQAPMFPPAAPAPMFPPAAPAPLPPPPPPWANLFAPPPPPPALPVPLGPLPGPAA
jgi:membrane-bound lytic murein transglycosylase B